MITQPQEVLTDYTSRRIAEIEALVQQGYSRRQICETLGLSKSGLRNFANRHKIKLERWNSHVPAQALIMFARGGRYSAREVANEFDIELGEVYYLCRAHSIDLAEDVEPPQPAQATGILPGPAKVEILRQRVERGESLWHPNDADHAGWRGGA